MDLNLDQNRKQKSRGHPRRETYPKMSTQLFLSSENGLFKVLYISNILVESGFFGDGASLRPGWVGVWGFGGFSPQNRVVFSWYGQISPCLTASFSELRRSLKEFLDVFKTSRSIFYGGNVSGASCALRECEKMPYQKSYTAVREPYTSSLDNLLKGELTPYMELRKSLRKVAFLVRWSSKVAEMKAIHFSDLVTKF